MTLRPEYALGHSEFNDFLFALVGEEKSGSPLTVLSALTRLGLDPWGEAARLSKMTAKAATSALAARIAVLPEGDWKASDSLTIASRLVDQLPRHVSKLSNSQQASSIRESKPWSEARKWLIWIGLAVTVFIAVARLFGH